MMRLQCFLLVFAPLIIFSYVVVAQQNTTDTATDGASTTSSTHVCNTLESCESVLLDYAKSIIGKYRCEYIENISHTSERLIQFTHVPKAGGTTVDQILRRADIADRSDFNRHGHEPYGSAEFNTNHTRLFVTVLRHPASRAVSLFNYIKMHKMKPGHTGMQNSPHWQFGMDKKVGITQWINYPPTRQFLLSKGGNHMFDRTLADSILNQKRYVRSHVIPLPKNVTKEHVSTPSAANTTNNLSLFKSRTSLVDLKKRKRKNIKDNEHEQVLKAQEEEKREQESSGVVATKERRLITTSNAAVQRKQAHTVQLENRNNLNNQPVLPVSVVPPRLRAQESNWKKQQQHDSLLRKREVKQRMKEEAKASVTASPEKVVEKRKSLPSVPKQRNYTDYSLKGPPVPPIEDTFPISFTDLSDHIKNNVGPVAYQCIPEMENALLLIKRYSVVAQLEKMSQFWDVLPIRAQLPMSKDLRLKAANDVKNRSKRYSTVQEELNAKVMLTALLHCEVIEWKIAGLIAEQDLQCPLVHKALYKQHSDNQN